MKKTMIGFVMLAVMLVTMPAQASEKPEQTYQVYDGKTNTLYVYSVNYISADNICSEGKPVDYSGHCVSPEAPTPQYSTYQYRLRNGYYR